MDAADRAAVEQQLGRRLRGDVEVAHRCGCGLPAVIRTHPLVDGRPFPTLFWLTCRRLIAAIGGLESTGQMAEVTRLLESDETFAADFAAAERDYVERRDALHELPDAGGIGGGPSDRIKCLHAHLAHHLVTGINPVGAWALERIGADPLQAPPCVEVASEQKGQLA